MKKENVSLMNADNPTLRITRARAAANCTSGLICPKEVSHTGQIQIIKENKRKLDAVGEFNPTISDAGRISRKKRTILRDATNVLCGNSYRQCKNVSKMQNEKKTSKQMQHHHPEEVKETNNDGRKTKTGPKGVHSTDLEIWKQDFLLSSGLQNISDKVVGENIGGQYRSIIPEDGYVVDIDRDEEDPQTCSVYASEIYKNLCSAELIRRPQPSLMEELWQGNAQVMRGILVDWLVEVSEEYKLMPDTLYLTIYFMDLFLSENCVETQRLQVLGITCMLIASKYEEVNPPRIEEFCFITDNTYTRSEVVKMEMEVLNHLGFQLSFPTTKTFLRRFIRAAQATYNSQGTKLKHLANYLGELSLMDLTFLKFRPSLVAAAAVFLALWTLAHPSYPWTETLEHYTSYKACELKPAALALQDIQLNKSGSSLQAVSSKYRQYELDSVAELDSPKLMDDLFDP